MLWFFLIYLIWFFANGKSCQNISLNAIHYYQALELVQRRNEIVFQINVIPLNYKIGVPLK